MDHHSIDSAYVMGHSMGGKTAMQLATSHPDRVTKLIIADIAPKFYPAHHHFIFNGLSHLDFDKISDRREADEELSKHIKERGIRQFLLKNPCRMIKGCPSPNIFECSISIISIYVSTCSPHFQVQDKVIRKSMRALWILPINVGCVL